MCIRDRLLLTQNRKCGILNVYCMTVCSTIVILLRLCITKISHLLQSIIRFKSACNVEVTFNTVWVKYVFTLQWVELRKTICKYTPTSSRSNICIFPYVALCAFIIYDLSLIHIWSIGMLRVHRDAAGPCLLYTSVCRFPILNVLNTLSCHYYCTRLICIITWVINRLTWTSIE